MRKHKHIFRLLIQFKNVKHDKHFKNTESFKNIITRRDADRIIYSHYSGAEQSGNILKATYGGEIIYPK